jgi:hypothetical protein
MQYSTWLTLPGTEWCAHAVWSNLGAQPVGWVRGWGIMPVLWKIYVKVIVTALKKYVYVFGQRINYGLFRYNIIWVMFLCH